MFIDSNDFEAWMKRIWDKLESVDKKLSQKEKERRTIDGELLLDNQDLCLMLNISKRTLQRYRSTGLLPCKRFDQKTYYLESEVKKFVREYLQQPSGKQGK